MAPPPTIDAVAGGHLCRAQRHACMDMARSRSRCGCRMSQHRRLLRESHMRTIRFVAAFALMLAPHLSAQNAPAPAGVAERLNTPQARVIVATLQPHTPANARN